MVAAQDQQLAKYNASKQPEDKIAAEDARPSKKTVEATKDVTNVATGRHDGRDDTAIAPETVVVPEIEAAPKPSLWKRLLIWFLMILVFAPIVLLAFQYYEAWKKEKIAAASKANEWDFYKLK
ncbi:MAG: hypothetical protein SGARI_005540, partial [Bacillariaceae sp.]